MYFWKRHTVLINHQKDWILRFKNKCIFKKKILVDKFVIQRNVQVVQIHKINRFIGLIHCFKKVNKGIVLNK